MTYTFCTLFDKNYIYRGLALHDSLVRTGISCTLYILCLDEEVLTTLRELQLPQVILVPLPEVESDPVLKAKSNRTRVEYYWTLASVFTHYLLQRHPEFATLAYIDSDVFFFSTPEPLYAELAEGSVLIIRHNYSPELRYVERRSGIYNVGVVVFKNDEIGMSCLARWKDDCLAWCYNRLEDGKFGDQMYLNDWPQRYPGVRVLAHRGGGVAPWNVSQYVVRKVDGVVEVVSQQPLIFFHFHTLRILGPGRYIPHSAAYNFRAEVYECIYQPYYESLTKVIATVRHRLPSFTSGFSQPESVWDRLRNLAKRYMVRLRFSITRI